MMKNTQKRAWKIRLAFGGRWNIIREDNKFVGFVSKNADPFPGGNWAGLEFRGDC